MKRMIATIVLAVLIMLAAVCAGWTWDDRKPAPSASSSVSTLTVTVATEDATEDGAWGS